MDARRRLKILCIVEAESQKKSISAHFEKIKFYFDGQIDADLQLLTKEEKISAEAKTAALLILSSEENHAFSKAVLSQLNLDENDKNKVLSIHGMGLDEVNSGKTRVLVAAMKPLLGKIRVRVVGSQLYKSQPSQVLQTILDSHGVSPQPRTPLTPLNVSLQGSSLEPYRCTSPRSAFFAASAARQKLIEAEKNGRSLLKPVVQAALARKEAIRLKY